MAPVLGPTTKDAAAATGKPIAPNAAEQLAQARANTLKAADERKAQAEKAAAAAKEAAEAKREAAELANGSLERQVGLVEGTMKVFIDLVEPGSKKSLFRVFGPEEKQNPNEPKGAPGEAPKNAGVTNAYTRNTAPMPLKDVGIA